MLHIFQLTYIYCINKLVTCETTLKMKHLIFLLKNVTTWRQMLSVFRLKFKNFKISSIPFLVANTNQNEKKIALPSSVCHRLPENASQVNQLYNVTWSTTSNSIKNYLIRLVLVWIDPCIRLSNDYQLLIVVHVETYCISLLTICCCVIKDKKQECWFKLK